ncbi:copper chaperone PCu(A)C [Pseudoroseomonas wenyumeiae]|uniref:Copper chaperone PCu(A)C n=1 Tax=Teichococcus wenyumeiae TaxID=2478470 RepID=A0A3A9J7J1_9PROT|nr:copper chaperone PCu(A)C [Pseudoroseomonas wenyumeiae]RMI20963.1 copper chaperone PCu(A)C [Pseudoroseomonas wenyumeiae]
MLAALGALSLPAAAMAHSYKAGEIDIGHPWSRAAPAGVTGAGYLTLTNKGSTADRLVGARAEIARAVEIHSSGMEGGVMRMRPVEAIEVAPGAEVQLAPGGLHIMLIGLKQPLVKGARVPLTLVFEKAGEVAVELAVEAAGARGGDEHQHQHGG